MLELHKFIFIIKYCLKLEIQFYNYKFSTFSKSPQQKQKIIFLK